MKNEECQNLIQRSMQSFWEGGYENTQISDIAEQAGTTENHLKNILGNKENVFQWRDL